MIKLCDILDCDLLEEHIANKYVNRQRSGNLAILNYSHSAQYDKMWDDVTKKCRGLIYNSVTGDVVSRAFEKFFNVGEVELPLEEFDLYEKADGSLGIFYRNEDGNPRIATRGSFTSDQAIAATQILQTKYASWVPLPRATVLWEIIVPFNRIVLDYGDMEDLILLAVIDNDTGEDLPLEDARWPGPVVRKFDFSDLDSAKAYIETQDNFEGFVIKFASGVRAKMKGEEYLRLHRICTQTNAKTIWEILSTGGDIKEILDRVPDEFFTWVSNTASTLNLQYHGINMTCASDFAGLPETDSRKEIAEYFKTCKYPGLLFAMLDGQYDKYKTAAWKMIKPRAEKPFKEEI